MLVVWVAGAQARTSTCCLFGCTCLPLATSRACVFDSSAALLCCCCNYPASPRTQESAYAASRAEALHNVETTIVELGSIFTQLAEMVAAQVGLLGCNWGASV